MKIFNQPIFFEKNRVYRVYEGGKLLGDFVGDGTCDGHYPEEWIASSVEAVPVDGEPPKAGVSVIEGTNMYLDEAIKNHKEDILGNKSEIGILVKFLDSAIRLPLQAHPDKAFSRKNFNSDHGKEESWIILGKRPGGCVYFGFDESVTKEKFSEAIDKSETDKNILEPFLVRREVEVGDVIFVPAKAVHAIGAGCLILEVQEPTDFTIQPEYWCGDTKLTHKDMYMNIPKETALECFDFAPITEYKTEPKLIEKTDIRKTESLIDSSISDNFKVNRITLKGGEYTLCESAGVYVIIGGSGTITGDAYKREIKQGDYFLLPHSASGKFKVNGDITIIECYS